MSTSLHLLTSRSGVSPAQRAGEGCIRATCCAGLEAATRSFAILGSDRKTKLWLLKSKNESDQIERKNFMESLILAQDERWRYA